MNIYQTLEGIRAKIATLPKNRVECVLLVETDDGETGYVGFTVSRPELEPRLRELKIRKILAEHTVQTADEILADAIAEQARFAEIMASPVECDGCRAEMPRTGYWQWEGSQWGLAKAYYCETCRRVLGAVGAGEYTALQERAGEPASIEAETKGD